jgi:outer membrane assembly lipoprotein YfiO
MRRILEVMGVCAVLLAGCGKPDPQELFKRATEAEQAAIRAADTLRRAEDLQAAFKPAIELYARISEEFPGTEYAEQSLFKLATLYGNNERDYQKAIDTYKRYVELYPGSPKGAVCMFLIGYIYNNELGNSDSARVAYERFLQKYPDHEMAASAQFELNSLGKKPEELVIPAEKTEKKPTVAGKTRKK